MRGIVKLLGWCQTCLTSMRKSKRASAIPPLRKGASDEEIIRWTTTHDVFERLEAGVSEIVTGRSELDQLLQAVGRIVRHEGIEPTVWGHIDHVWVGLVYRHCGVCRALIARLPEFFGRKQVEALVLDYVTGDAEAEGMEAVWVSAGIDSGKCPAQ